jgi:hypothetical protein
VNKIDYVVPFYLKTEEGQAINVEVKGELVEVAIPACDIIVTYESKAFGIENDDAYIVVGGDRFGGKMEGLCGDCNGQQDDYRSSDGTQVDSANRDYVIGTSWMDKDAGDDEDMPDRYVQFLYKWTEANEPEYLIPETLGSRVEHPPQYSSIPLWLPYQTTNVSVFPPDVGSSRAMDVS